MSNILLVAKCEEERRKRQAQYAEKVKHYQTHPIDYFHDRLGIKKETIDWTLIPEYKNHTWDGTPNPFVKILDSLVVNKWIGVESATGTGKTFNAALIALWFLECFENSVVITTAPKQSQLSYNLWKEISKLYPKFGKGELLSLQIRMIPRRDEWTAIGFVAGIKANEESTTRAQGFHSEHMLIIFEETTGVPNPIITAFQNTCVSPHNLIVAFGNPDHQLDNLHRFCLMDNVEHIRISAYDHPNIVLNNPFFVPGASSMLGIERITHRFGQDNPMTLSRTRGISPMSGVDALVNVQWVYEAINNYKVLLNNDADIDLTQIMGEIVLGVDVANSEFGDKASICKGKGNVVYCVDAFQCPDSNQLGHQIYRMCREESININNIGVDGVGVGAGTVNTLIEYGASEKQINLQSGASQVGSPGVESFNNLRSQMWWQLREDLRHGRIMLINDEDLIADIVTPKYRINNKQIVVESKDDIKKRLGRSPNKGDSLVYWNWIRNNAYTFNEIITYNARNSSTILKGYD